MDGIPSDTNQDDKDDATSDLYARSMKLVTWHLRREQGEPRPAATCAPAPWPC